MADIQYLNYGDLQIELLALLNSLANNVQDYVAKQSWSNKRKLKFMSAYSDIMNKGLLGASNTSGQWMINVGGDIDLNSKDLKDKEMYQEAAYFIQQQMAGLPTKSSLEKKDNSELPKYDSFGKNFINYVSLNYYGGNPIRTQEDWNILDERNPETGLRGTDVRIKRLSDYLKKYSDSLEEGKYNFEGSPFENLTDLKTRINTAITKLNDGTWNLDDTDALNAIGLRSSDWFNNGSGDKFIADDGNEYTYGDYYGKILPALKKAKAEALAEALIAKQKAAKQALIKRQSTQYNRAVRNNPKMIGTTSRELAIKYKNDEGLKNQLSNFAQSLNLTTDLWHDIVGAFLFYNSKGALQNLSKDELNRFSTLRAYNGLGPSVLKKLPGVDGFYFDTRTNQVIKPYRTDQQGFLNGLDLLELQNPEHLLLQYMNSTEGGFTPAELREVAALLFDLGAAVDPEGVTSATLSLLAAGIRDYNRKNDPEGWTWGDTGWAALDHGLGLLSVIPVVGGLLKGSWAAAKLGNYIPKMERWIRLAGRAGSTYAMATNAPGALNTLNKIKNEEDLSLKDYLDLAYFFIGSLGHHQLNRGNRIERSAMKARGIETSNSVLNKAGITRTKAKTASSSETTPTLKVLKTGEDGKVDTKEIPITEKQKAALRKAKPDKLNEAAAEAKISNIPEGYTIVKPTITPGLRSTFKSWFGKGNSEIFGTPTNSTRNPSTLKTDEEFEQYLSEHNNTWLKKFFNGSNRDIRRYDRYLGNNSVKPTTEQLSETPKAIETSEKPIAELRKSVKDYLEGTAKHSGNNLSEEPFKAGDFNFEVNKFPNSSAGNIDISFNGNIMENISFKNQKDMMKKVANFLKENRRLKDASGTFIKRINAKEMGEILKQLKAKGVFKQGGTIDKLKIQEYKEFIKK